MGKGKGGGTYERGEVEEGGVKAEGENELGWKVEKA